ncbi:MAG: hypothetical protein GX905_07205 [Bacteroidales bacterium]|nr:hypothetical protein [Bacteroidales bacterium]
MGTIRGIYGDWMQVSIPNAEPEQSGWIRWKDCNGILQGIFSFTAIY